ncbi:YraN family protein [Hyphobacterium sp. CCMP332]|nr:YraN family protein [Hyphobacterium sp. CCMP332]
MTTTKKIGDRGEDLAVQYLNAGGYKILEQKYRFKRSEIDIIAEKEEFIVFVEVKTRKSKYYGYPEAFVDSKKAEMIHLAAEEYLDGKPLDKPIRFDIISIIDKGSSQKIEHFKDAF